MKKRGGRVISVEAYSERKATVYCINNSSSSSGGGVCDLFLPDYELLYFWNGFSQQPLHMLENASLPCIESLLQLYSADPAAWQPQHVERRCCCLLYKAMIERWLLRGRQCESTLAEAVAFAEAHRNELKEETWILPHLYYELGSVHMSDKRYDEALACFKLIDDSNLKNSHFNYRLSFKVHMSTDYIKKAKK